MTDVAQAIARLTQAARQAGHDQATGQGAGSEIPVNAARQVLNDRLDRLGIDGCGWHSEREILTDERDRALAKVEELEETILDLHHRLDYERRRADSTISVHGLEGMEPDGAEERIEDARGRWTA